MKLYTDAKFRIRMLANDESDSGPTDVEAKTMKRLIEGALMRICSIFYCCAEILYCSDACWSTSANFEHKICISDAYLKEVIKFTIRNDHVHIFLGSSKNQFQ